MAQTVILKRSSVAGKVPLTTDLSLGELALNTYDGKLYTKKDDGTESIVDLSAGTGGGNNYTVSATAPSSPSVGDFWLDLNDGIQYTWIDDGNSSQWIEHSAPVAAPVFLASTIPPTSPNAGDEWLDETSGLVYRYVDDAWVEIGPGGVATGATAYDVAVANGFQGSEAQWLTSLVGATGATGPTGPPGEDSPGFTASTTEPVSPDLGDEWLNLTTGVEYRYITTASGSQWVETSAGGGTTSGSYIASSSPPASPDDGDRWYDIDLGIEFTYVSDSNSSQWVETSTVGGASSSPIVETQQVISQDIELSAGTNGLSVGPVEVAETYTVTVPVNAIWAIV